MLTGRTNREGEWRKQGVERSANCWSNVLGVNEEVSEPLYRSKDSPQLTAKTIHPWKQERRQKKQHILAGGHLQWQKLTSSGYFYFPSEIGFS